MKQYLEEVSQLILKEAGWSADRHIDTTYWKTILKENGYEIFDEAERVLSQFGGLRLLIEPFYRTPFYLTGEQKVTLHHRIDPFIEFLPEETLVLRADWLEACKTSDYIQRSKLKWIPIGLFHDYNSSYDIPLILLSDGSVGLVKWTLTKRTDNKICFLRLLGSTLEESIQEAVNQFLVFW
ncbi:MAG: SUKH-3 domain-containing protein [Chloroflexota bacterium]